MNTDTMHFTSISASEQWIITTRFFKAIQVIDVQYDFDNKTRQLLQGKAFPGSKIDFSQILH